MRWSTRFDTFDALYDLRYTCNKPTDARHGLLLPEDFRVAIGGPLARRRQVGCDRGASHIQLGFAGPVEPGLRLTSQSQLAWKTLAVQAPTRLFVQMDGRNSRVPVRVSQHGGAVSGDVPQ